jgi:ribosomal-protein-alanine N-acetyltransferase
MNTVRKAEKKDVKGIVKRENVCFSTPETEESIYSFLKSKTFFVDVIEDEGIVTGHCIYFFVPDNAEIISLAVTPEKRRMGYGRDLVYNVIERAKENNCKEVYLEVRKSNETAISLYTSIGFHQVGERKNLYSKPEEDGLIMQYLI